MSATLWHLEALGLPAHADQVAVRRAYAVALRRIDPATDPSAFEALRRAYEAAREWCAHRAELEALPADVATLMHGADDAATPASAAGETSGGDTSHTEAASTVPLDYTVTLAWRFAADVGARRTDSIPQRLDDILAELRTQYIDAPGQFEEHLIDLVGHQRIAHRADVFAAAETRFHWSEVGHLAALGQRGQWIEQVLAQREAWLALATDRRREWLDLCARAEVQLDTSLLSRWPEMAKLNERFPAWLSLHVSDETLQAWKAAFDAQSPSTREGCIRRAPGDSAYLPERRAAPRGTRRQRTATNLLAVLFMLMFLAAVHFIMVGVHGDAVSLTPPLPLPADTPRQCADLYAQLDQPDAFVDKAPQEVADLKTRAHRCQRAGHWHPESP